MRTLLAIALLAASVPAAALELPALFDALARRKPVKAQFTERKYLSLLDKPVESRGELTFTPPDRMEKRTTSPRAERVVIDRERITLERGGKSYGMGMHDNPGVAVLVESIRATLAGDLATLTRTYSVGLDGDEGRWRLLLRPLDPALSTLVERIEIGGAHADVRRVEIFQADGDRSVMTIAPVGG